MKTVSALKDFLDTRFADDPQFIHIEEAGSDVGIKPVHHAWYNSSNAETRKEFDDLESSGEMSEFVRSLAFTGPEFKVEDEYPDYVNYYVYQIYEEDFINPLAGMMDTAICIVITKEIPDGYVLIKEGTIYD